MAVDDSATMTYVIWREEYIWNYLEKTWSWCKEPYREPFRGTVAVSSMLSILSSAKIYYKLRKYCFSKAVGPMS
jgi:hypothetical protein